MFFFFAKIDRLIMVTVFSKGLGHFNGGIYFHYNKKTATGCRMLRFPHTRGHDPGIYRRGMLQ